MAEPLWTPSSERIAGARATQYREFLRSRYDVTLDDWHALYDWSVANPEAFWRSIWDHAAVIHSGPCESVKSGEGMLGTKWFSGAELNFAENLLRHRDDRPAIVHRAEKREPMRLTHRELYRGVAAIQAGLQRAGVAVGDRVAGLIPNIPEAVIAMLATTATGATWSSCSPDFGFHGILDRFGQIAPKVLFAADSYHYNGKPFDCLPVIRQILESIPSIERAVIIRRGDGLDLPDRGVAWDKFADTSRTEVEFEQLPFDHPVYIMYSSGTTGKPKCMVHGAGGTLMQHYKEHVLHTNLDRDDLLSYYTTCGWMMWNWLVSGLQIGASIFLYDGSPTYPDTGVLWRAVEEEGITVFGTSPKFLSACEAAGVTPGSDYNLDSLKAVLSTGSPLSAANFEWVYASVKQDLQLSSISGGTDIVSCFMLGSPVLPVYSGEIQTRGLGMKVEAFDDSGKPVVDTVGELVCTAPFPSQPTSFWNDPDGSRYRSAYFDHFPGVWRHGDFVRITGRGGVIVYGRSDATLNPGGVRIGTAEIYAPVESMSEVADSLVVGQRWHDDVRVVLFVVTVPGVDLTDELRHKIKTRIRQAQTPRHVPRKIIAVNEIPHTINGKKVEMAVTRIIHGQDVTNRDALANPDSLVQFIDLPELSRD